MANRTGSRPGRRELRGARGPYPAGGRGLSELPGPAGTPGGVRAGSRGARRRVRSRGGLCLPLWGSRALLSGLAVGWAERHEVGITERATLTAASGYSARAVERAQYPDERISVARELQAPMLTDLPLADGTALTALDAACAVLPIEAGATLVHTRLGVAPPGTPSLGVGGPCVTLRARAYAVLCGPGPRPCGYGP
ncbi:hypothetical protein [Streptomyces lavendulae]|uniref:hypothetical protein n=1 Tax=Streptomyces lavendulae TaxID=1914 RepID=UPI0031F061A6